MRVAIVTHNLIRGDGQGRVNYETAGYLLDHGAQLWLIADSVEPDLVERGATWVRVHPPQRKVNLFKVSQFAALATRALRALPEKMDIVHGNGFTLNGCHQINTAHLVHGAWLHSPVHTSRLRRDLYGRYQWAYTTLNARWERRAYGQAQLTVAVSERVRGELRSIGVPDNRIRVILNGVDVDEFRPGSASREVLGLPEGVPLMLFAGEIRTPRKNLDTVLQAMTDLPGAHLAVVGDAAGSPYPEMARRLGVAGRVRFLGFRHDVADVMRAADAFVFPSRYEACSLVLLEALSSGLPVITAETAGGAEVVTPESGVVLPDPNDAAALASCLRPILMDSARRTAMGQASRDIALRHSWARMAEAYLRLYREVTG